MTSPQFSKISALFDSHEDAILADWLQAQSRSGIFRSGAPRQADLKQQSATLLRSLRDALRGGSADIASPEWAGVRGNLEDMSRANAQLGASPTETASSIFSLKQPVFSRLVEQFKGDPEELSTQMGNLTTLLDKLGLYTVEMHQKSREAIIVRQQQEMMELSTPVVELWKGILAVPLIGTLDSQRTQVVMENLLQKIADTGAPIAIVDITGVPTVDTLVAQHLLKTISAARLMGADCIVSGIRPQIAQTIVHLGVALGDVLTKATLADAFGIALKRMGLTICKSQ
ncbi:MAG TPA: STAS domain-containing protein [Bryobacteraceae bacterium]|jgi:rsbT co-antagonist protein RsbR|nr:STAS domain-containing protein [Bryobacteraceae bacterium]